jgi:hypothetical protein
MTMRPVAALAFARLRRRGGTSAIAIAAVAGATALVAIVSGIGLIGADATLARAFPTVGADRPVVRISHFSLSPRGIDATMDTLNQAIAATDQGFLEAPIRGVLTPELRDLADPSVIDLVVAVDGPAPWLAIIEGRAPAPCLDGVRCEAILLSEDPAPTGFDEANPAPGLALTIVGRGRLDAAIPFDDLDQRGPFGDRKSGGDYQTERASPAVLLVDGVEAVARSAALDSVGRTYVWTSPLDPTTIHPWTADGFAASADTLARDLGDADGAFSVTSPLATVQTTMARADAAQGRLLVIASLGVAILLAFAVFLAQVVRDDLGRELDRLTAMGARRRDRSWLLVLETVVPTVIGGALGWIIGGVVVAWAAGLGGSQVAPVVADSILAVRPILVAGVVVAIAAVATFVASLPRRSGRSLAPVLVAAVAASVAVLGWQALAGGSLGPDALAATMAGPIIILLPPAAAFLLALVLASALPSVLRAASRRFRTGSSASRLSLLSLAREPGRPVAALTLLAFSVGAIVFAMGWSSGLRRGIEDGAAYRAGLDLRVVELGTGLSISQSVVPVDRYETLGAGVTAVPVYRDASPSQPGGRVEIVALPPDEIPHLPGWRDDFAAASATGLADGLSVPTPAGGWRVGGYRLPPGPDLTLHMTYQGDSLRLDAIVATDGGDSTSVALGTIREGMTSVTAALPEAAQGGTLTTLIFHNDRMIIGSSHQHELFKATVAFEGLDGLVDDAPIDLEIFTVSTVMLRAPQQTDDLVIPAIVSPDLAATADANGRLELHVGSDSVIPLRVAGTAERFPTVMDADPRFVVVPIEPYLVALSSVVPGSGRPSEMWIAVDDPGRLGEVRSALAADPFRFATVTSRADLVEARAGDPLSQGIIWALVIAAITGLILSVASVILGAVTDLRDERGELADLETQGIAPATLRRLVVARAAWLAVGGAIAGLIVGIGLTILATGLLALTADGEPPIPPLVLAIPVLPTFAVVGAVVAVILGVVAWLARRTYGSASLGEGRSGAVPASSKRRWRAEPGAPDG